LNLIYLHRMAHKLFVYKVPVIPKIIYYFQFFLFNSSVPASCKIGRRTKFAYGGMGVVLHARTVIGENCIVGQGVTIGGKSKQYNVPKIGNFVYIAAGARIIGAVTIGNNVIVGANAVLDKDVPDNCVVAGIPAKIIKRDINIADYMDL